MTIAPLDPYDVQQVRRADGLLGDFNRAHVLGAADVHVALRLQRIASTQDQAALLAAALAVRAVRQGSVCVEIATAAETTAVDGVPPAEVAALPWPSPTTWIEALEASPLVAVGPDGPVDRPLHLVGGLLYLDRYWRQERAIAEYVDQAVGQPLDEPAPSLSSALDRLFPEAGPDRQRLAALVAAHRRFSIVAGGPGTGKTTTVAKLLALLQDQAEGKLRVALAAPTGKAAARLQEAAAEAAGELSGEDRARLGTLTATTMHWLLGYRPGSSTRFQHDHDNRLPYDVVVIDEASMVSLTLMSRLVDALRPSCRLVLVGDPDQLASVEVGAVLGDLVARPSPREATAVSDLGSPAAADLDDLSEEERDAVTRGVVRLDHVYRFPEEIQALAEAIRSGEPDRVMEELDGNQSLITFVETDVGSTAAGLPGLRSDVVTAGGALVSAARDGDPVAALAALDQHRLLCAHRDGPYGVARWSDRIEEWLGDAVHGYGRDGLWYVGRPLLVTANDHQHRLYNGDTGVVVEVDGRAQAAFRRGGAVSLIATSRLSDVQTMHALSVHRSQGSQFEKVTVLLPPVDSPLLTRELLYTAVTRTKQHVRIIGTAEGLARAVRRPIVRASGLRSREHLATST